MKSHAHILLETHMKELGLHFLPEFAFHPERKWRFDYLIVKPEDANRATCAVEIEGGIWSRNVGRHNRASGYIKDLIKYREAAALGYKVYRFSTDEVLDGTAKAFLQQHAV
jgi:hypothetical protein